MLTIIPIPAFQDNYIWLLQHENEILCIDPGDAAPVLDYLRQHELNLNQIWLTHHPSRPYWRRGCVEASLSGVCGLWRHRP